MGWFWDSNKKQSSNVTDNLEPGLREFLEKEAPRKYTPSQSAPSSAAQADTYRSKFGLDRPEQAQQPLPQPPTPTDPSSSVPAESLYKDGRYAHLWSTYRPLNSIEDASKTDQDRLLDVLDGYKERRAQIGRAALENCAMEQIAVSECFRHGGWKARTTMCRAENRELSKCYMTQAKLLKALGYLRLQERTQEEEERIQMHADRLYHEMRGQEERVREAKEKGLPVPEFDPIVPRPEELDRVATTVRGEEEKAETKTIPISSVGLEKNLPAPNMPGRKKLTMNDLDESVRRKLMKRLEKLSSEERILEEQVIAGELEHGEDALRNIGQVYELERKNRLARKEAGRETFGDRVRTALGW